MDNYLLEGIPDENIVDVDVAGLVHGLPHRQGHVLGLQHLLPADLQKRSDKYESLEVKLSFSLELAKNA